MMIFILVLLLFSPSVANAGTTYNAADCEYATVSALVASADDGDTVTVPAGSCTWDDSLSITKAIILQGGVGGTTAITSNYTSVGYTGLFDYVPANPDSAHRFRLTNFSVNNGGKCYIFRAYQTTSTPETIRVDHNIITVSGSYRAFYTIGSWYGVIDSNTVTASSGASIAKSEGNDAVIVANRKQWGHLPRAYGDANNLYYEDNTFTLDSGVMISSGTGGRYLFRYNTLTASTASQMGEMHGNQPAGAYENSLGGNSATMIVEIYGNVFEKTTTYFSRLYDQRAGMLLFHHNKIVNSANNSNTSMSCREEYSDDLWPQGNTEIMRVHDSYSWANWQHKSIDTTLLPMSKNSVETCCDITQDWQNATLYGSASATSDIYCTRWTNDPNGYCWKRSQHGDTQVSPYLTGDSEPDWTSVAARYTLRDGDINWLNMGAGTPIAENTDWFTQRSGTFDGTGDAEAGGGVGCGTLTTMQAISTCTDGVGYWATTQSCSDLTGMVGANPSTPISGTLYKCASNAWVPYYTPYQYPHPLRGEPVGQVTGSFGGNLH